MILLAILSIGLTYFEIHYLKNIEKWSKLIDVYSLIGFVLSLLLVFRTNTAYDRWWEGRKKWGELVNNTRNLAIKINALNIDQASRSYFSRMISNYAIAMKEHLRNGTIISELDLTEEEKLILERASHHPNIIAKWIYKKLNTIRNEGTITGDDLIILDQNLKTFSDIIGACERIKNTPIPYSYNNFLKKFIFIYVSTIPLALVWNFGYYSALISVFIFYVLVSMEILAEEIEDPFGLDDNDLPVDELTQKITANVKEILCD